MHVNFEYDPTYDANIDKEFGYSGCEVCNTVEGCECCNDCGLHPEDCYCNHCEDCGWEYDYCKCNSGD